MKIYTDNTTTGIERIYAQCQENKTIMLCNYYCTNKWEITAQLSCCTIRLSYGNGTLDIDSFILWLESHGLKLINFENGGVNDENIRS